MTNRNKSLLEQLFGRLQLRANAKQFVTWVDSKEHDEPEDGIKINYSGFNDYDFYVKALDDCTIECLVWKPLSQEAVHYWTAKLDEVASDADLDKFLGVGLYTILVAEHGNLLLPR